MEELNKLDTYFASPERTDRDTLYLELDEVTNNPVMDTLLHSVGGLLAVVDENRQIVSVNRSLAETLNIQDIEDVIGLRPGEALNCNFAKEGPNGCGTGKFCSSCGAAVAIVTSLGSEKDVERNCYIETGEGELKNNLAFQVRAHPVKIEKRKYVVLFLQDITRQEQRASLERTFFHDINNLLQGLSSASEMLSDIHRDDKLIDLVSHASRMLVKEVEIQRYLLNNDSLDCHMYCQSIKLCELLEELETFFSYNPLIQDRHLLISSDNPERILKTDMALVIRILSNMITNALEATDLNGAVSLWTEEEEDKICFFVHNNRFISEEVALKIFHKNHTTKSEVGRGLGTFSMKLLGEKILGGKVEFVTSPERGTVFSFTLPL
ncbi:MAG: sensor histidine kinase [Spirochaetales bacterium]|nr:sensor histidine kinase [Spirochaetales bacterium]